LRHDENKEFSEIALFFKKHLKSDKTFPALRRKYGRTDWDTYCKDPNKYVSEIVTSYGNKWSDDEMIRLDAYLQAGKSYDFIAEKLGRSFSSIESRSQHTDWKAWRSIRLVKENDMEEEVVEENKEKLIEQYVNALLSFTRNEFERIDSIKESEFLSRVNLDKSRLYISFSGLKEKAKQKLIEIGYGNPESIELEHGRYVVVGDSHGKHTNKDVFSMLENINKFLKPDKIIHVGHILDDDNDISYDWGRFRNLIVLAKAEELKIIQEQRNKFKFNFDVVRKNILIGEDLWIFNQDIISDYVKTSISSLDSEVLDDKMIVNSHRMELTTRCTHDGQSYFSSPGCLCEDHIVKTIKQIDFEDGRVVKQAFHDGFIKYRRMRHMNGYWEQGLLVVDVNKNGKHTIVPCPIKKTSKGFTTSYFDKIIASKGIFNPDRKIFVNGDFHCDKHDVNVLDIQEQICKDYKPDAQVNVGDTFNYSSLNHHVMDRGGVILDKKILDEAAYTHYVLKRVRGWAKDSYLIYGNHERFSSDFVEKYPQFGDYLDFKFMCCIDELGYKLIPLKKSLKIGSATFIHGEIKMYGQSGTKLEKASRTFGKDLFIGHIHRPEIRFGCYSVGLSGQLDQDYNEPEASNWMHGFGLCNQFMGQSWLTTVSIENYCCNIGSKIYKPVDPNSWKKDKYTAKIVYDFH
jgi:hypothetical protein